MILVPSFFATSAGGDGNVGGSSDILVPRDFPIEFFFTRQDYLDELSTGSSVIKVKSIYNPNPFPVVVTFDIARYGTSPGTLSDYYRPIAGQWNAKNENGFPSTYVDPAKFPTWFDDAGVDFNWNLNPFGGETEKWKSAFRWHNQVIMAPVAGSVEYGRSWFAVIGPTETVTISLKLSKGNRVTPYIMPAIVESLFGYWWPQLDGYNTGVGGYLGYYPPTNGTLRGFTRADLAFNATTDVITATVLPYSAAPGTNPSSTFTPLLFAPCKFTGTGNLPAPLAKDTIYYMKPTGTPGEFRLTATPNSAADVVNITGTSTSGSLQLKCNLPGGAGLLASNAVMSYQVQAIAHKEDFR